MPSPDPWSDGGLVTLEETIRPAWIDRNEHMNVLAYDILFEGAETAFYDGRGIDPGYVERRREGIFRLEKHLTYERELRLGTPVVTTTRLVWTDLKLFHVFHQLWNRAAGQRAATMECMAAHVDLATRRIARMTDPAQSAVWLDLAATHGTLPLPPGLGRAVGRRPGRDGAS
jgi:acyl-CoA thioester hydrolase